ncbi:hypothetical protein V2I01_09285 [Micromonospora sp. BRA006-A]|nr:hypothetical protein [Micromonospora sp. BRA006-A]
MAALRQYQGVWRIPGAPMLLILGIIGRLGIGIPCWRCCSSSSRSPAGTPGRRRRRHLPLSGAALSPVAGRIADRVGPTPVLLLTAVTHPLALIGLLVATRSDSGNLGLIYLASGVAGATYPPLTAAIRGAWNDLTAPPPAGRTCATPRSPPRPPSSRSCS